MSKEDKILEYLEKIYRISKYRLIRELREEELEHHAWVLDVDEKIYKILPDPDGYIERTKKRMDELNDCCPWIGDIVHEKERKTGK